MTAVVGKLILTCRITRVTSLNCRLFQYSSVSSFKRLNIGSQNVLKDYRHGTERLGTRQDAKLLEVWPRSGAVGTTQMVAVNLIQ